MRSFLKAFSANRDGATAIEYAMLAGCVAIAIITSVITMGDTVDYWFSTLATEVQSAKK